MRPSTKLLGFIGKAAGVFLVLAFLPGMVRAGCNHADGSWPDLAWHRRDAGGTTSTPAPWQASPGAPIGTPAVVPADVSMPVRSAEPAPAKRHCVRCQAPRESTPPPPSVSPVRVDLIAASIAQELPAPWAFTWNPAPDLYSFDPIRGIEHPPRAGS